jgi:phosphodiesterase/alkaline phosphatase D-like protein
MNPVVVAFAMALALNAALTRVAEQEVSPAGTSSSSTEQLPAPAPVSPIGTAGNAVQITNGPVVENVTDTTAEIAWSTNVNAGTTLRYGTDPGHLDLAAGMPWGGLTHRVTLKDLQPNTTYYFRAESSQGQGTGTQALAEQSSFQTKPAGISSQLK